jgi:hypothetical protein
VREFQFAGGIWNTIGSLGAQTNIGFVGFMTILIHMDGWHCLQADQKQIELFIDTPKNYENGRLAGLVTSYAETAF